MKRDGMNIKDGGANNCCSCGVCAVVCPYGAITIEYDDEGFYRPLLNEDLCICCGKCKMVCPKYMVEDYEAKFIHGKPVYAAWSKCSETVYSTSSGGIGYEIAKYCLENGYNVCGVEFDASKDDCRHVIVNTVEQLEGLKRSKYLQSYTPVAFKTLKEKSRFVVTGTPCQIYGIRNLIKMWNREEDFVLIDFFCHGTPTKLLWIKYRDYLRRKHSIKMVEQVNFRSKTGTNWHRYKLAINNGEYSTTFFNDLYFKLYLSNSCLNKSCYDCQLRMGYAASDIRIGDFWGSKYKDNIEGVSLVVLNSVQGSNLWDQIKDRVYSEKCETKDVAHSQPNRFIKQHKRTKQVMELLKTGITLEKIYTRKIKDRFFEKLKSKLCQQIRTTPSDNTQKIGLLTLAPLFNYGGILQAYALQKVLKDKGYKVWVIDRRRDRMKTWRVPLSIVKRALLKYLFSKNVEIFLENANEKKLNTICTYTNKFIKQNIHPITPPVFSTRELKRLGKKYSFDIYVVGSDQVWRPKFAQNIGDFFLKFAHKKAKRIAYSASFGTDEWEYDDKQTKLCGELLRKFDAVSVREESAIGLCKSKFGVEALHTLDPTMLLEVEDYIRLLEVSGTTKKHDQLLVYFLTMSETKQQLITTTKDILNLVPFKVNTSTEDANAPIKERIAPPVEQWLRALYEAKYIITDSFHGTVFSILFNKPFIVYGNKRRGMARFISLLNMFGLEKRLIVSITELNEERILEPINWDNVNEILFKKRKESIRFLNTALDYIDDKNDTTHHPKPIW